MIARALAVSCLLAWPAVALAQDAAPSTASPPEAELTTHTDRSATAIATFLAGGALGRGLHEAGHLLMVSAFRTDPGVTKVGFGPLPFFVITHGDARRRRIHDFSGGVLGPARVERVASHPAARPAPGATFGPYERDTRAMADALDISEPWVGVMILAPAALDTWRYMRPQSRWAAWSSRALKVGAVLIVVRAAR